MEPWGEMRQGGELVRRFWEGESKSTEPRGVLNAPRGKMLELKWDARARIRDISAQTGEERLGRTEGAWGENRGIDSVLQGNSSLN